MLSHNGRKHVLFQSTLPRGERPSSISQFTNLIQISIHAPTRGATCDFKVSLVSFMISIHAPTRGATDSDTETDDWDDISIHAPTRGATAVFDHHPQAFSISIHAPTRGATSDACFSTMTATFQSTLPRGERQGTQTSHLIHH